MSEKQVSSQSVALSGLTLIFRSLKLLRGLGGVAGVKILVIIDEVIYEWYLTRKCRPTSEVPMGLEAVSLHRPVCHF